MPTYLTHVVLATTVLVALGIFHHFTSVHAEAEPFDRQQWRARQAEARQNDPGCVRGGMALSLVRNGSLDNSSRSTVLALLGDADETGDRQLHFSLGQCHWDWRSSALVVRVDAQGIVEDVSIEAL
ncbi:hypothetical protein SAMN05878276_3531 [Aquipseudomonas alcaligenes]|uniref:hypothetical protein n=1 Tax=Aquipseudomonas alcaligenes TaxID=43263 RepID=UPI0009556D2E|nr:hypothetical protein [Pseudomonas alcaligenes]SIS21944.1 hypothetical protein SAMN05878276_3531 [Pseudomonas alcaligenes]